MHIKIIISIHLYCAHYLHGMHYPYLSLLLNFVLLTLMSGCIFKLAQLVLVYIPVHIILHEPFIKKREQLSNGGQRDDKSACISTTKVGFSPIIHLCHCMIAESN